MSLLPFSKTEVVEACIKFQSTQVDTLKKQLNQILESANDVSEGGESFREQLQVEREMYNKKLREATETLEIVKRIDSKKYSDQISVGSLIKTTEQTFFICTSIGELKINGNSCFVISTSSPVYELLAGKKKGQQYKFRDKTVDILEVK
jgi:regulator of replication initiation timing